MMTKEQFCKMMAYKHTNTDNVKELEKMISDNSSIIYTSSCLAVALEYLLNFANTHPELYKYTRTRGGVLHTYVDEESKTASILSMRELLDMLPDTN